MLRSGGSIVSLALLAVVLGVGLLVVVDRIGDRRAYAAAETYLQTAAGVRRAVPGPYETVRTGGSVSGGQVGTWRGEIRGGGRSHPATVVVRRGGDAWHVWEARMSVLGDWIELVRPRDELRGGGGRPAPLEPDVTPTPELPMPALAHPFLHTVTMVHARQGLAAAVHYADSVARANAEAFAPVAAATEQLKHSDPEGAADRMYAWLQNHPGEVQAAVLYSRYLRMARKFTEAHQAATWAIRIDDRHPVAYHERARAADRLWGAERSWRDYQRACELGVRTACPQGRRPTPG